MGDNVQAMARGAIEEAAAVRAQAKRASAGARRCVEENDSECRGGAERRARSLSFSHACDPANRSSSARATLPYNAGSVRARQRAFCMVTLQASFPPRNVRATGGGSVEQAV